MEENYYEEAISGENKFWYLCVGIHGLCFLITILYLFFSSWYYCSLTLAIGIAFLMTLYFSVIQLAQIWLKNSGLLCILMLLSCYLMFKGSFILTDKWKINQLKALYYSNNNSAVVFFQSLRDSEEISMWDKPPSYQWTRKCRHVDSAEDFVKYSELWIRHCWNIDDGLNDYEDWRVWDNRCKNFNDFLLKNGWEVDNPYFIDIIPPSKTKEIVK